MNIGFIGLGNMGFPMAGHLKKAGHNVIVWNRSYDKANNWAQKYAGTIAQTPKEVAEQSDAILICVGRDSDVQSVFQDENGLIDGLSPNKIIIDHTTTSAMLSREIAEKCHQLNARFADAPVSGGQAGAESGQLSVMVGCNDTDFDDVKTITAPFTKVIERMGEIGAGQQTKMVNQICVAGLIQALAEGMHFAEQQGLNMDQVMKVISQGAAGSWQMDNRQKTMQNGEYNHGFAIDWMRKDLQICLQEAVNSGASLPVTALVDQFYGELQQQGCGRFDTSALLYRLQRHQK